MAFDRRPIVPIARYKIDIYDRMLISYLYYIDLFYRADSLFKHKTSEIWFDIVSCFTRPEKTARIK
jgi:hypothetical protein